VLDPLAIFGSSQMLSWIYAANPANTINTGRFEVFADGSGNGRTYGQVTAGSRAAQSTALGFPSALFSSARPDFYSLTGPSYGSPRAVHVIRIIRINADPPADGDPRTMEIVEDVSLKLDFATMRMVSRAYHDSLFMARLCSTTMIFIPCRNGYSHRPEEYSDPAHIAAGARVLAGTLARLSHEP
jgi:hypothetical protein